MKMVGRRAGEGHLRLVPVHIKGRALFLVWYGPLRLYPLWNDWCESLFLLIFVLLELSASFIRRQDSDGVLYGQT